MPAVNNNYTGNGSGRYNRSNNDRDRRGYNNYGGDRGDRGQRDDFTYEIVDSYGVLSASSTGWTKELNRVSWNGNAPKFDIREWSQDHGRMRRGVTFTEEEALELRDLLDAAISGLPVSAFSSSESSSGRNGDEQSPMFENADGLDSGPLADDVGEALDNSTSVGKSGSHNAA